MERNVVWLPSVNNKLVQYRSEHFTPEETLNFILTLIIETEEFLKSKFIGMTYTEEFGPYQGFSRVVIKKFRIYYKVDQFNIIILGVLFPGEK